MSTQVAQVASKGSAKVYANAAEVMAAAASGAIAQDEALRLIEGFTRAADKAAQEAKQAAPVVREIREVPIGGIMPGGRQPVQVARIAVRIAKPTADEASSQWLIGTGPQWRALLADTDALTQVAGLAGIELALASE